MCVRCVVCNEINLVQIFLHHSFSFVHLSSVTTTRSMLRSLTMRQNWGGGLALLSVGLSPAPNESQDADHSLSCLVVPEHSFPLSPVRLLKALLSFPAVPPQLSALLTAPVVAVFQMPYWGKCASQAPLSHPSLLARILAPQVNCLHSSWVTARGCIFLAFTQLMLIGRTVGNGLVCYRWK